MKVLSRSFLRGLEFRNFTQNDYYGFAGVSSPVPMISDNGGYLVIIDGVYAEVYSEDGELLEQCNDIMELGEVSVNDQIEALERQLAELKSTLAA